MKRVFLLLCFLCLTGSAAFAQQDARYTKFMFNKLVFNPAYAGSGDGLSLVGIGRYQWVNIDGAPRGATLSAHAPLDNINKKSGIGGWLEYDQLGVHQRISLFADYSYSFILGQATRLSLGISGGGLYMRSDYTQLKQTGEFDPFTDPAFNNASNVYSKFLPNFGLGLYLYNTNKYYLGASVPHLLDNKYGPTKIAHQFRHYHFMGGLVLGSESFKVHPSFLVKMVPQNAPVQLDANLLFFFKDAFYFGATYRTPINNKDKLIDSESIDALVGFAAKNGLRIGYAYDYTLSEINQFTSGLHEIMLGYNIAKQGYRVRTPRYF